MSYTPEDQKLADRIEAVISPVIELSSAMRARIDDHEQGWDVRHKRELVQFLNTFDALRLGLRNLQESTR